MQIKIQSVYRGHLIRKATAELRKEQEEKLIFFEFVIYFLLLKCKCFNLCRVHNDVFNFNQLHVKRRELKVKQHENDGPSKFTNYVLNYVSMNIFRALSVYYIFLLGTFIDGGKLREQQEKRKEAERRAMQLREEKHRAEVYFYFKYLNDHY